MAVKVKESNKKLKRTRVSVPQWQIPPGLTVGNFDYTNSSSIAADYDQFLAGNDLHQIDREVFRHYLPALEDGPPQGSLVADFGCGNGRSLLPLLSAGYRGLGIDLSLSMLESFAGKARQANLSERLSLAKSNLVQLEAFSDNSIDAAICMFSTLGMIHGRQHRDRFLKHVRRMLKPNQPFILHAHNSLFQIRQHKGVRSAASSLVKSIFGKQEFGDRTATYRGVKNMFIHSFRRAEIQRDLKQAGFTVNKWIGIRPSSGATFNINAPLPWFSDLRLVGWVVVCR